MKNRLLLFSFPSHHALEPTSQEVTLTVKRFHTDRHLYEHGRSFRVPYCSLKSAVVALIPSPEHFDQPLLTLLHTVHRDRQRAKLRSSDDGDEVITSNERPRPR